MTIKEALTSTVNFSIPENRIEKALIDADLTGSSVYSKSDEQAVDTCMEGLLLTLITSADVTEDDVSVKLPSRDVLMKVRASLIQKWEPVVAVTKPTVKQVRFW
jgi:ribosome maturation protein Sdo1